MIDIMNEIDKDRKFLDKHSKKLKLPKTLNKNLNLKKKITYPS